MGMVAVDIKAAIEGAGVGTKAATEGAGAGIKAAIEVAAGDIKVAIEDTAAAAAGVAAVVAVGEKETGFALIQSMPFSRFGLFLFLTLLV